MTIDEKELYLKTKNFLLFIFLNFYNIDIKNISHVFNSKNV